LELIKAKAEIDAVDSKNTTPLYIACASGKLDIVKILVRAYANPDIKSELAGGGKKKLPIQIAKESGFTSIVSWLRNHTPDAGQYPNLIDRD